MTIQTTPAPIPKPAPGCSTPGAGETLEAQARQLDAAFAGADAATLVAAAVKKAFPGRIALVSSFGSSAAVLLHMVAAADPATPVLFLDTGKHFGETRRYRDALAGRLGLARLVDIHPDVALLQEHDPQGVLWLRHADRCCHIRKVLPLQRALGEFDAWLTGRRRQQGASRAGLARFEAVDGRIKINPLADWTAEDVDAYFTTHDLPRHPLEADGFRSIGCLTCTERVTAGEDERAGRWRGSDKTECGIHLSASAFKDFGADI